MLLDEAAARHGQPLDIHWCINDLRGMTGPGDGAGDAPPTEEELRRVLPRTKMYWNHDKPENHGTLYFFVDSGPGRLGWQPPAEELPAIYMRVWADAQHFA